MIKLKSNGVRNMYLVPMERAWKTIPTIPNTQNWLTEF